MVRKKAPDESIEYEMLQKLPREMQVGRRPLQGICHYKATNDLRRSHPTEKHGQRKAWPYLGLKKDL